MANGSSDNAEDTGSDLLSTVIVAVIGMTAVVAAAAPITAVVAAAAPITAVEVAAARMTAVEVAAARMTAIEVAAARMTAIEVAAARMTAVVTAMARMTAAVVASAGMATVVASLGIASVRPGTATTITGLGRIGREQPGAADGRGRKQSHQGPATDIVGDRTCNGSQDSRERGHRKSPWFGVKSTFLFPVYPGHGQRATKCDRFLLKFRENVPAWR